MQEISVIVPIYKVEPYLRRCVDSIIAQTFADFDLILVDDGSPDNCGEICDGYARQDSRITVIHQENKGLSAARNSGIDWAFENSDSKWLCFIDSDDWIDSHFLENLYRAAIETCTLISACAVTRTSAEKEHEVTDYSVKVLSWDDFYSEDPVIATIAVNKLYNKQLFTKYRYPEDRLHEDEFLTYKLLYTAEKVAYLPAELYIYYQNSQSITKGKFTLKRIDAVDAIQEQCEFFQSIGKQQLFLDRMHIKMVRIGSYLIQMDDKEKNKDRSWEKAKRKLRTVLRKDLIRYGKIVAPLPENWWLYDQAYPTCTKFYWTICGIVDKLKK